MNSLSVVDHRSVVWLVLIVIADESVHLIDNIWLVALTNMLNLTFEGSEGVRAVIFSGDKLGAIVLDLRVQRIKLVIVVTNIANRQILLLTDCLHHLVACLVIEHDSLLAVGIRCQTAPQTSLDHIVLECLLLLLEYQRWFTVLLGICGCGALDDLILVVSCYSG